MSPQLHWVDAAAMGLPAGQYAILKAVPRDSQPMIGLNNHSAKINILTLADSQLSRQAAAQRLMHLPGMNRPIAEAIVDFVRKVTGEQLVSKPAALPELALRDLLSVSGVTGQLLWGEDVNGNGILDVNEDDGDSSWPADNADGQLQAGWSQFLTVEGGESCWMDNGQSKIRLNQADLGQLYDQLIQHFSRDEARFVIAWRSSPAIYPSDLTGSNLLAAKQKDAEQRQATVQQRLRTQSGQGSSSSNFASQTRAGIQLTQTDPIPISSLIALANCKVQIQVDGVDQVLVSPFSHDPTKMAEWLMLWEQKTTTSNHWFQYDRVNINQAPLEVLLSVDGINDSIANAIIQGRQRLREDPQQLATMTWPLVQGIVDLDQLRQIAPQITTGGSVFTGVAAAQLHRSRTMTLVAFQLDQRWGSGRLGWIMDLPTIPTAISFGYTD